MFYIAGKVNAEKLKMTEYEMEKFEESLKDKIYSIPRASGNAGCTGHPETDVIYYIVTFFRFDYITEDY